MQGRTRVICTHGRKGTPMLIREPQDSHENVESSRDYRQTVLNSQIICQRTILVHIDRHQSPFRQMVEGKVPVAYGERNRNLGK
jgi:hypothetical protein